MEVVDTERMDVFSTDSTMSVTAFDIELENLITHKVKQRFLHKQYRIQ